MADLTRADRAMILLYRAALLFMLAAVAFGVVALAVIISDMVSGA
jgi:hypothetical protein